MASPQVENGYTRIANELHEVLCKTKLSGHEFRCFLFILRKTYGYQKKRDRISWSQFEQGTAIGRRSVQRAVGSLIERDMVVIEKNGDRTPNTYSVVKDYDRWRLSSEMRISAKLRSVLSANLRTTKEKKDIYMSDSEEYRLSALFCGLIKERKPNFKQPSLQSWARHIDLMRRIDGRSSSEIERVMRWVVDDSFWAKNVLSTEKLREKFDRLEMQMDEESRDQIYMGRVIN